MILFSVEWKGVFKDKLETEGGGGIFCFKSLSYGDFHPPPPFKRNWGNDETFDHDSPQFRVESLHQGLPVTEKQLYRHIR
jgi:hypothetical protein